MFHKFVLFLIIFGAINVGLVEIMHLDLIGTVFGTLSHLVYALVGISGLYTALTTYTTLVKKA